MNPSESPNEPTVEEVNLVVEETQTVADDILAEVGECRTRLETLTAGLERLQSADVGDREKIAELLQEIKNERLELKNLTEQVRLLQSNNPNQNPNNQNNPNVSPDSQPSTHSTPLNPEAIDPSGADAPEVPPAKRRRYRVI